MLSKYFTKYREQEFNNIKSEYLGSNIIKVLGGSVQTVEYCYNSVKIQMLEGGVFPVWQMQGFNASKLKDTKHWYFDDFMQFMKTKRVDLTTVRKFILELFVYDSLLLNSDRHIGNIMFRDFNGVLKPAEIIDNDACLMPRHECGDISQVVSMMRFNNAETYHEIWKKEVPSYCRKFLTSLKIERVNKFIHECPYLNDDEKEYYIDLIMDNYEYLRSV